MKNKNTLLQILQGIGIDKSALEQEANQNDIEISSFASIDLATKTDITFLREARYEKNLKTCSAGACFVPRDTKSKRNGIALIRSNQPEVDFVLAANYILNKSLSKQTSKISKTAQIGSNVKFGENVSILDFAIIKDNVSIGDNSVIGEYSYIGQDCIIGNNNNIHSHVRIEHAIFGDNVAIDPGAKIGFSSFGFIAHKDKFLTKPHIGKVIIEDNVEIGINAVVDRGYLANTKIGESTRIGSVCTIAHNVIIGRNCIITAQTGIAGSTKIGDKVIIGGQAGIVGHLDIGSGAIICAKSGVTKDINPGEKVMGYPAQEFRKFVRANAHHYLIRRKHGK